MTTYFPSIEPGELDFNEDWLVESLDENSQIVTFVDSSDSLSVGELVHLPKELFIVSQEGDAKIDDVF